MKIAVIMSVYRNDNTEFFIEAASSIFDSKLPSDVELNFYLGVDGRISEDLDRAISKFSFHKVVRSEYNLGLANMLNKLIISLGDEEFVFRMDSDDISCNDRFLNQLEYMKKNPNVDICGGSIREFNFESNNKTIRSFYYHHDDIFKNMYKSTALAHVTACFRRSALLKIKSYSSDYPLNEDIELWFRALELGLIINNVPEVLVDVRVSNDFYSRRSLLKAKYELVVFWKGTTNLYGFFTWKKIPVIAKFIFRLMPGRFSKLIYESNLREQIFK